MATRFLREAPASALAAEAAAAGWLEPREAPDPAGAAALDAPRPRDHARSATAKAKRNK